MFEPTFLYIKQHAITGKCYFGKTTYKDPVKYKGSGLHWKSHIKEHGIEHVETLWYKLFMDQEECTRVALLFSEQQDIVKSDKWLNLIIEDGLFGTPKGTKQSPETCATISAGLFGKKRKPFSVEHRANLSAAFKGRQGSRKSKSAETRARMRVAAKKREQEKRSRKNVV